MSEITPNTPNPVREDAYKEQLAAKLGIDPQYIPGSPIWHSEEEIAAIAEMFSNMSGGGSSGGGVLVVHDVDGTLDKTFKEINDAFTNGALPVVIYDSMIWYPAAPPALSDLYLEFKAINLTTHNSDYYIYSREYIAESETSYPVYDG